MKPLRIAVIGLRHGATHIPSVLNDPRSELAALVDMDAACLGTTCQKYGMPGFATAGEMAAAGVADAAIIAVPTACHASTSEICLQNGLHVLLEKPLCRTDKEAAHLQTALEKSGRVLQVGYEVRSAPLHRAIMGHIARGDLGEVTNVWWHQHTDQTPYLGTWRGERANMGGVLFDCAAHFLDILQQWSGAPLHRVVALGNLRGQTGPCARELPDSVAIALEYHNGVRGTYNLGAVNRFNDDASFGVAGTTGRITGNPREAGSYELRQDKGVRVSQVVFDGTLTSMGHLGFHEEWGAFLDTIVDGAPNVCSFQDALSVHRQMRAIDRSLATGHVVELAAENESETMR